jgi:hypothetical protein
MDIFLLITFILLIILILIIICEILNRKFNESWNVKYKFNPNQYSNYIVDLIGITRSNTTFAPNTNSNLITHTDIILYCHHPETLEFNFILMYSTNYHHLPIYETIENDSIKYNMITNVRLIHPNHKYRFKIDKYKYRITNLYPVNMNWNVGDIYEIYKQILQLPYHRLQFNCHHVVNFIIDITTNRKAKYFFELDNSSKFKPLWYLCNYLKEQCGYNIMNISRYERLKHIISLHKNS